MQSDIVVPAFEMDCRDWLVTTADAQARTAEGAPILAMLSTAVLDGDSFRSVSAVLMLGVLDDDVPPAVELAEGAIAAEMLDLEADTQTVRYLLPCPDGQLALVAEFDLRDDAGTTVRNRIEDLMVSFRWSA